MTEIIIFSLTMIIFALVLLAQYKMVSKVVNSIKNIAQFVQGRENIEKVKEKLIELKEVNNNLIDEIKMGRIFYDNSIEAIVIMDINKKIISTNPAFIELTGYTNDEMIGKTISFLDAGRKYEKDYELMFEKSEKENVFYTEIWNRKKTGEIYNQTLTLITTKNNDVITNYIGIFKDITAETENKTRWIQAAKHDALTGLPNRSLFEDRLEQALINSERNDSVGAMMFLDLDHFKSINDTLGHHVGDLLLKEVAIRLKDSVRASDTVARLSGDEFTIILPSINKINDAGLVAETIIKNITKPYKLENNELTITCSVGVSIFPIDSKDIHEIMSFSDQAMYKAKSTGKNGFKFYSNSLNETAHAKRDLDKEIRNAINKDLLYFNYKPMYDKEGKLTLLDINLNLKSQNITKEKEDLMSLTEESTLIIELTDWTLRNLASKDLEILKFNKVKSSIEISAIHFKQNNIVEKLIKIFSKEDAEYIQLRIKESVLAKNVIEAESKIEQLRNYGFDICIEDFGTGNLSYKELIKLNFNSIKSPKNLTIKDDKKMFDYLINTIESLNLDLYITNVDSKKMIEFIDKKNNGNIFIQSILYPLEFNREELLKELEK